MLLPLAYSKTPMIQKLPGVYACKASPWIYYANRVKGVSYVYVNER